MKRQSWTHQFQTKTSTGADRTHLARLDEILYDLWSLGRNIILVWSPRPKGIDLLVVPHVAIVETANGKRLHPLLDQIIAGPKQVFPALLDEVAGLFKVRPRQVDLSFAPGEELDYRTISALVKRYSITRVEDRAVALFDIVGFSRNDPLVQVTQLNSLSYSVNTAYSKLMDQDIEIRFARTNTGDGFYIWNRDRGISSNVDLYHFMHLVLAENALTRSRSQSITVPVLRTCFHVGSHYEFYQSEGLNPTTFSYIVGDVTIELARMIEQARDGQILIGDFLVPMMDENSGQIVSVSSVDFIERTRQALGGLNDLELGDEHIASIQCYLTGRKTTDGGYRIGSYRLADKHGFTRWVFNAKVNIHRQHGEPIYLGLQDDQLHDFGVQGCGVQ